MAEVIGSAKWTLDLDKKGFDSGAKDASAQMSRLEKTFGQSVETSKKVAKGLGVIALGIIGIGAKALSTAADFQQMGVSLETVFQGNKEAAAAAQKQILDFTAKTPFQIEEVMGAFIKLKNLGLDPSERALRSYGDTASAMGKSLDQMVEAVADATVGEFERLKEFGIRSSVEGDRVKFTFRGVTTEVGKNAGEIEKYLLNLGEVNFAGGMEAQSQTLNGLISTLKDNIGIFLNKLANDSGLIDIASKAVKILSGAIETLNEKIDAGGGLLEILKIKFKENEDTIYIIAGALAGALTPAVLAFAGSLWTALAPLLPFIIAGAGIALILKYLIDRFGGLQPLLETVKLAIMNLWNAVAPYLLPALQYLWDVLKNDLFPALTDLWNLIKPHIIPVSLFLAKVMGGILLASIIAVIYIIGALIKVVVWLGRKLAEGIQIVINYNKTLLSWFASIPEKIKTKLSGAKDAIINAFKGAFDWLAEKLNTAKEQLDKLNPFHRESPSLVDWINKGTKEITDTYDNMFSRIGNMTAQGRVDLVNSAKPATEKTGSVNNVTLQAGGIVARSRSEWREIMADGIDAVNEALRAQNKPLIPNIK